MEFFYIDETQGPGKTKIDDLYILVTVAIPANSLRATEEDMRTLAQSTFGGEYAQREFHGHDIYSGKGPFKGVPVEERIRVFSGAIDILEKHDLHFGHVSIDRRKYYGKLHPHEVAFLLTAEHIENRLAKQQTTGLLVADENHEMEEKLVQNLELFKTQSTNWGYRPIKIEHVADSLHFARSKHNRLIQLTDMVATVTLHGIIEDAAVTRRFLDDPEPAHKPPNMLFPAWREKFCSNKEKASLALWHRLNSRCFINKQFPQ